MTIEATHLTHAQNLNSLRNYLKKIDADLNALGHTIGAELKGLDASLAKGAPHARKYLPKPPKASISFEQAVFQGLLGRTASSTGSYKSSSGQLWAQIASGVSKAIVRGL